MSLTEKTEPRWAELLQFLLLPRIGKCCHKLLNHSGHTSPHDGRGTSARCSRRAGRREALVCLNSKISRFWSWRKKENTHIKPQVCQTQLNKFVLEDRENISIRRVKDWPMFEGSKLVRCSLNTPLPHWSLGRRWPEGMPRNVHVAVHGVTLSPPKFWQLDLVLGGEKRFPAQGNGGGQGWKTKRRSCPKPNQRGIFLLFLYTSCKKCLVRNVAGLWINIEALNKVQI